MSLPLFVYGTLRDAAVLARIIGRTPPAAARIAASAPDLHAVHYDSAPYPALTPASGETAPGLLLLDLTPTEIALLDAYEGEEYRREPLLVLESDQEVRAQAYMPTRPLSPDARRWTLEDWTSRQPSSGPLPPLT